MSCFMTAVVCCNYKYLLLVVYVYMQSRKIDFKYISNGPKCEAMGTFEGPICLKND